MTISGQSLRHSAKQLRHQEGTALFSGHGTSMVGTVNKGEGPVQYIKICEVAKGRSTWWGTLTG